MKNCYVGPIVFLIIALAVVLVAGSVFGEEAQNSEQCVAIAPDFLMEGAEQWCKLGMFIEVRVAADVETREFHARMQFNTEGYHSYLTKKDVWIEAFNDTQASLMTVWRKSTLVFKFGDNELMRCDAFDDVKGDGVPYVNSCVDLVFTMEE